MAFAASKDPPLDEVQWRSPLWFSQNGMLGTDNVLYYFSESPFFDRTSNNYMIMTQSWYNINMRSIVMTRKSFEAHLASMSGLEYVVAQEPAEMAPGTGTGVWVIRKQTRRKHGEGKPDEITVHADYFVVGENIYMAPTFVNVLSSRLATISNAIGKMFDSANNIQKWTPAEGHIYKTPKMPQTQLEPKEATPMPDGTGKPGVPASKPGGRVELDARLAEESLSIHLRYGGDYMDENPITGKPGDFHFSSTGRKDRLPVPQASKPPPLPALNTKVTENPLKDGRSEKSPKTPGSSGNKRRRKSKPGATPS